MGNMNGENEMFIVISLVNRATCCSLTLRHKSVFCVMRNVGSICSNIGVLVYSSRPSLLNFVWPETQMRNLSKHYKEVLKFEGVKSRHSTSNECEWGLSVNWCVAWANVATLYCVLLRVSRVRTCTTTRDPQVLVWFERRGEVYGCFVCGHEIICWLTKKKDVFFVWRLLALPLGHLKQISLLENGNTHSYFEMQLLIFSLSNYCDEAWCLLKQ